MPTTRDERFDVVLSVGRGGVDRSQEDTRAMRLPEEPEVEGGLQGFGSSVQGVGYIGFRTLGLEFSGLGAIS